MKLRAIAMALLLGLVTAPACGKLNFDPQMAGQGEFSPASIGGLQLWLRADQGVTSDPSNDTVMGWKDSISGSLDFTPPSGAASALLTASNPAFGGRSSINFQLSTPSTSKHLQVTSASLPYLCDGTYSIFVILKPNMGPSANALWTLSFTSGLNTLARANLAYIASAPSGHTFGFNLTNFSGASKPIYTFTSSLPRFLSTVSVMGVSFSGLSTVKMFRDGSIETVTSATTLNYAGACPTVNAQVGLMTDSTAPTSETVDFAEILIYDWSLGASEMNALGCYAKNKYGISNYSGTCN